MIVIKLPKANVGTMQRYVSSASRGSDHGPKALADCDAFATLAEKAGALEAMDRALRQTLPLPLREQVKFADLRNNRLVFLASSPAWASRLRLMQTQILASAAAIGLCASSVTVKVAPQPPAARAPDRSRQLSAAAATHLKAAAASSTDAEWRALFLDLASLAETDDSSGSGFR